MSICHRGRAVDAYLVPLQTRRINTIIYTERYQHLMTRKICVLSISLCIILHSEHPTSLSLSPPPWPDLRSPINIASPSHIRHRRISALSHNTIISLESSRLQNCYSLTTRDSITTSLLNNSLDFMDIFSWALHARMGGCSPPRIWIRLLRGRSKPHRLNHGWKPRWGIHRHQTSRSRGA